MAVWCEAAVDCSISGAKIIIVHAASLSRRKEHLVIILCKKNSTVFAVSYIALNS